MFYSRFYASLILSAVMLISSMVIINTGGTEAEMLSTDPVEWGSSDPPTRATVIEESESNNGWSTADRISSTFSDFELHGNVSSNSDHDFFKIADFKALNFSTV